MKNLIFLTNLSLKDLSGLHVLSIRDINVHVLYIYCVTCVYDSKIAVFTRLSDKILTKDIHFAVKIINFLRQVMLRLGYVINCEQSEIELIFFAKPTDWQVQSVIGPSLGYHSLSVSRYPV
jgi:hypothetical protein